METAFPFILFAPSSCCSLWGTGTTVAGGQGQMKGPGVAPATQHAAEGPRPG